MYLIYDDNGNIIGRSTTDPRPILSAIEVDNCPHNVETHYFVANNQLVERSKPYKPPLSYVYERMNEYDIHQQLNLLVDDITDGKFGEDAKSGKFYQYVINIKNKYPK